MWNVHKEKPCSADKKDSSRIFSDWGHHQEYEVFRTGLPVNPGDETKDRHRKDGEMK